MRRTFATVLLSAVVGILAMTTAARAAIKTEVIEYTHGGVTLEGFLAYDDALPGKRPAVLVCHEWWGNNDYSRSRARQLAELGYVALALDMYGKGKTTASADQAGAWAGEIMKDTAVLRERAAAGLAVLQKHERVDAERIAAIGYCMGGTVALELARSGAKLAAVVCFHTSTIAGKGTPEQIAADTKAIRAKVLICHGQEDTFVQDEQIKDFHAQMKAAGVDYTFVSYGGAVHSFTNPAADGTKIPGVKHQPEADRRSWGHMRQLFDEVFAERSAGTKGAGR